MSLSGTVLRFVLPKEVPGPEQLTIAHAGDILPITFVRNPKARRASLRVDPAQRRIVLTAPLRMARATALGFAEAQAGWIAARLKRLPSRRPFVDGAELPLFGEPHRIRHRADKRGAVWREGSEVHVAGRPEHLPRRLRDWLTAELRGRLVPLVQAKAAKVERPVKRITLRDSRSRWGSCGPNASAVLLLASGVRAARGAGLSGGARGRPSRAPQPRPALLGAGARRCATGRSRRRRPGSRGTARSCCSTAPRGVHCLGLHSPRESGTSAAYSAAARTGPTFSTSAACLATPVPSKKRGFCRPHRRTALAKVKSRKSSAVISSSSTSS